MDIKLAFTSMLSAITLKSSQNLADGSIKMWNIVKEKSYYDRERIIIKYIDVITKAWKYIDENGNDIIKVRSKLKSIIDLVLKPLIKPFRTIEKWLENYTSDYFLKFIQGITLFHDHDLLDTPAYHRSESCGPKNADDEYNLANINCIDFTDIQDLFRKRRNSWNCYLERRIYDDMYRTILNIFEQNFGHRLQLRHIEVNNLESCFPLMYFNFIQVKVLWAPDLIPIGLEFTYTLRDNPEGPFKIVIENYHKKFNEESYLSTVSCEKITEDNGNITSHRVTQSVFKQKIQWAFQSGGGSNNLLKNNLQDMMKSAREKHIRVPIL
jgi:hypothetical protein